MDPIGRFLGSGASLLATAFQLGAVAETWPSRQECELGVCWNGGEPGWVELFVGWEPYIDNGGVGGRPSADRRCPGRQSAGSRFRLDHSPLPAGFQADAHREGDILACVKLGADGSVRAVRLVAGTGSAALDRRLLRSIASEWRFRPAEAESPGADWQRIRLTAG